MDSEYTTKLEPLPQRRRLFTFLFMLLLFVVALPFLFLYATGYRFDFGGENTFAPTGGMYIAADRTEASIFINDELVRETRTFGRAFYAQGLEPGTHRVHVQKINHHTWVKELPVYAHRVTEAQAFNLPLDPAGRVYSPWRDSEGRTVVANEPRIAPSNEVILRIGTTVLPSYIADTEYSSLLALFDDATTTNSASSAVTTGQQSIFSDMVSKESTATTTKLVNDMLLFREGDDVYARWVGSRDDMPYYFCVDTFAPYNPDQQQVLDSEVLEQGDPPLIGPVQVALDDTPCDPTIVLNREGETVVSFDFYPGNSDFIVIARTSGVYVVEIDNRAWQNVQPILEGEGLDMRVENNNVYVYDGEHIYQMNFE